ncbi:uncharacterized protein LOC132741354 [Ruditapes philippinarum]|uniref:uncharacterized protein LOC132741354 n=1 Tax=Ruditapes philippinarum TaxID=129788 RepID=UPI00295BC42F|nr:uncharacterized protein LOC132741354 [Ruditapes philippinarum]
MGTGHSKGTTPKLTRNDPKRFSWKKKKLGNQWNEELGQDKITEQEIIEKRETCLAVLKKSVTKHDDKLNSYNDKTSEIKSLLEILQEHKTKSTTDYGNGDVTDSKKFRETIERIENVLKEFQMLPECARDSFKDVKHNITECVAILEENIKVVGDMNMKPVRRPPAVKRRNTFKKEPKHKTGVSAAIQIFCKQEGKLMNDIHMALETTLKGKLGAVDFTHLNDISKIDNNMVLIITCIAATRIAADASYAMQDIKNPANAALVIIDVDEAHELSNTHNLTGNAFKDLRAIFGLSFMKSNGSFPNCDMNDKSINGLCSLCKQELERYDQN